MDRGLYIAATGMLAEQVRQDQIANDLANVSTTGYKGDRAVQASFADLLLANRRDGSIVGPMSLGAQVTEIVTDLDQGPLKETGESFDVALEGEGFLAVQTPNGVRYTRDGQLEVDASGQLRTAAGGYPVLDQGGKPITLSSTEGVSIGPDGAITIGTTAVATLGVVSLTGAQKEGDSLFTGTAGARPAATTIRQGFLEGSGADAARSMVDMIVSLRAYEASQRVLRTIDDTLGRAVNAGSTSA